MLGTYLQKKFQNKENLLKVFQANFMNFNYEIITLKTNNEKPTCLIKDITIITLYIELFLPLLHYWQVFII